MIYLNINMFVKTHFKRKRQRSLKNHRPTPNMRHFLKSVVFASEQTRRCKKHTGAVDLQYTVQKNIIDPKINTDDSYVFRNMIQASGSKNRELQIHVTCQHIPQYHFNIAFDQLRNRKTFAYPIYYYSAECIV